MYDDDRNAAPFNPLPPVVWALALAIVGVELVFEAGARGLAGGPQGVGWRLDALNRYAFIPERFSALLDSGLWTVPDTLRLVGYAFVHLGFAHVLFVVVLLLALGKMVGEVFSAPALLAVFLGAAVGGAVVYGLAVPAGAPLIGGYPAVYGLIGAYSFILWTGLGALGQARGRAFSLIALLMGIQLVFALLFGGDATWVADLAGFATGFALSLIAGPGGWRRLRDRMRQR